MLTPAGVCEHDGACVIVFFRVLPGPVPIWCRPRFLSALFSRPEVAELLHFHQANLKYARLLLELHRKYGKIGKIPGATAEKNKDERSKTPERKAGTVGAYPTRIAPLRHGTTWPKAPAYALGVCRVGGGSLVPFVRAIRGR